MCGRSKKGKEEKAEAKKAGKKAPEVSKQAKDAARKKFAAAMREVVSKQGKAYDRIVREMDRDQYREYVLSVRHAPLAGEPQAAILSDWLPICEVIVADKVAYEVRGSSLPKICEKPTYEDAGVSPRFCRPRTLLASREIRPGPYCTRACECAHPTPIPPRVSSASFPPSNAHSLFILTPVPWRTKNRRRSSSGTTT